ncbi:uncharacterized protein [Blastocystis hominis]|uniref:Uncharacterized protein n=1 Tax=Blastocystis hominis TaxID=12968 RepID=D8M3Z0_BLAHO|nr:uncharacterized protein [Blastocystis hominis]CBK22613.2 unnamed protein product [Blastocystis hominis]|eukprot:XP_012896661.1 uncharacterized protein [Blastocystis hominis]
MTSILGFGSQYKAVEQSGNRLLLHDAKESNEHSKQVEVDQVRPYCT